MPNYDTNRILFGADIAGTVVFAMEDASAGISNHLDLLGLIVLALAGGVVCFLLRVVRVWQHWNLPKVSGH